MCDVANAAEVEDLPGKIKISSDGECVCPFGFITVEYDVLGKPITTA